MLVRRLFDFRHVAFRGDGMVAGLAPDPGDPVGVDGRLRKVNVPTRGRVVLYERSSMRAVESVLSAADGTWQITNLRRDIPYVVIGFDDAGAQNAAIQDWVVPAPME